MVPRIILAMGAARVEAVPEPKFASSDPPSFDLIVVKEQNDANRFKSGDTRCVHLQWVKDSLIAGRLLPFPELG